MHRITLTAGPRTTRPDQILSCCFFCRFSDDLVVTQGIEIMLVPTAHSRSVSACQRRLFTEVDRKSTRLNSSHSQISYAVFCLKKKKKKKKKHIKYKKKMK